MVTARPLEASQQLAWHTLGADQVLHSEEVDAQHGLSSAEAAARVQRFGPNKLAAGRAEPRWHAFVRQYRDPMQIVLLAAGIGSLYPLKQLGTGLLLILLTLFNAVEGLHQEGKAAQAVAALRKTMVIKARVRRDGQLADVSAEQLVPGDIVSIEAGDVVPADGRLLDAAMLEIDESALTGESLPVSKGTEIVPGPGTPPGDRTDMVYMKPARTSWQDGPPGSPDLGRPQTTSMEHRCCSCDIDGASMLFAGGFAVPIRAWIGTGGTGGAPRAHPRQERLALANKVALD